MLRLLLLVCLAVATAKKTPVHFKALQSYQKGKTGNKPAKCVLNSKKMPAAWGSPIKKRGYAKSWSAKEDKHREKVFKEGVLEMVNALTKAKGSKKVKVKHVRDTGANDAIEMLLDASYYNGQKKSSRRLATKAAQKVLIWRINSKYKKAVKTKNMTCLRTDSYPRLYDALQVLAYSDQLLKGTKHHKYHTFLLKFFNDYWAKCGNLVAVVGDDSYKIYKKGTKYWKSKGKDGQIYDLFIGSMQIANLLSVPGIPKTCFTDLAPFLRSVMVFFREYRMRDWDEYKWRPGYDNNFCYYSYTATHMAELMNGYSRYLLKRDTMENPWLYDWARKNLYKAMQKCGMELAAEILDNLKQYGCDERNDRQVRDGTRWLIDTHSKFGSFSKERDLEDSHHPDEYDILHKPWVGTDGVAKRKPWKTTSSSLAGIIRSILKKPITVTAEQKKDQKRRWKKVAKTIKKEKKLKKLKKN